MDKANAKQSDQRGVANSKIIRDKDGKQGQNSVMRVAVLPHKALDSEIAHSSATAPSCFTGNDRILKELCQIGGEGIKKGKEGGGEGQRQLAPNAGHWHHIAHSSKWGCVPSESGQHSVCSANSCMSSKACS